MISTTIVAVTALTGLLILGFSFETFAEEPNPSGPVPVPYPNVAKAQTTKAIPDWVKNQFEWYVNGEIDEKTLLTSMNWMFDNNVMHLSEKAAKEVNDLRTRVSQLEQKMSALSEYSTDSESGEIRFGDGEHGERLPDGSSTAAPYVPGGSVVSAAISGIATVDVPTEDGVQKILVISSKNDINSIVQMVLRESYIETNKDLQFYAEKVRYHNDMKEAIRDKISDMRSMHTDMMTEMYGEEIHTDEYGRVKVQFPWDSSDEHIDAYISEMKKSIDSLPTEQQEKAISSLRTIITTQTMGTSTTGDGTADYDRLTIKADLAEHEKTISKFMVLQKDLETIEDEIKSLTERIDSTMVLQKTLRKDIALIQDTISKGVFPAKVLLSDGVMVLESARDADALIQKWEDELTSAGDDAQLANIDLQNALQKQQQTLQTISNVSKMMHDTAMAVIRKIG
ncbi:MAG TPA: hypothetical protein VFG25_03690 [Nitrosopumilaceae archaeon]|nr:hypothetical protein [Nitrosopumilaceae archaeon]